MLAISPAVIESYDELVEQLGIKHRSKYAERKLMAAASLATGALRQGLRHANDAVRVGCCRVLDHYLDEKAGTPGGPRYERLLPKPPRKKRQSWS